MEENVSVVEPLLRHAQLAKLDVADRTGRRDGGQFGKVGVRCWRVVLIHTRGGIKQIPFRRARGNLQHFGGDIFQTVPIGALDGVFAQQTPGFQ